MKKQIWKFVITPSNSMVEIPIGAEILTIQAQGENPCIWAMVDPSKKTEIRQFDVFGTGHDIIDNMGFERKYINTFQLYGGALVFHLFERIYK